MSKKECIVKSLRLKTDIISEIEKIAEKENRSFTNMVETILIEKINQNN